MLIVFEGIDGSGKDTQIRLLSSFLRQSGVRFSLHKYPTRKAKLAFAHLKGKRNVAADELALVFADDIMAEQETLRRESSSGTAVICDRYLHSTLAYQSVKAGYAALRKKLASLGAITPDIVILLDIGPLISASRKRRQKKPDRHERNLRFLAAVRKNYRKMARQGFLSYKYAVIDASQPKEAVAAQVAAHVEPLVTKKMSRE